MSDWPPPQWDKAAMLAAGLTLKHWDTAMLSHLDLPARFPGGGLAMLTEMNRIDDAIDLCWLYHDIVQNPGQPIVHDRLAFYPTKQE